MKFYLTMFFLNMFIALSIKHTTIVNKNKVYLIITFIQMTLIAGLRADSVGWDTHNYIHYYDIVDNSSSVFRAIKNMSWVEPGYIILCYIVKLFRGNAQISLMVAGALVYAFILHFVYRYSDSPVMGVMAIFCFPVFYDSLSMLRNAIVCAIFLWGIKYIEEKNFIKYIIYTLVAMIFHTFSVIFIPLYFVRYIKWKRWYNAIFILIGGLLVYHYLFSIIKGIIKILKIKDYEKYVSGSNYWFGNAAGGLKTAIFYLLIVLLGYYLFTNYHRGSYKQDILAGYSLMLPAAAFCYTTAAMFIRVMLLMMPIAGVFVSNEIKMIPNRNSRFLCLIIFVTLLIAFQIFTLWTNAENYIPYIPFWRI